MPAVSKKQQRFFGYLLSNPDERKKRGISKKSATDFAKSVDESIERQAKDRKKLSQPHSVAGSRRDHSHDVDSALTDYVPRKGKGRMRPASKKDMRVSAMRDAGIKEEKECPAGQYYCFDMGKCRPIPKGHKVRKDGELVKEGALADRLKANLADKKKKWDKQGGDHKKWVKDADETVKQHKKELEKINEVSPPGWGHTKAEKEKTKPWKPKSKIGGSAAEFKKDLDSGKFKGLPGDKTKKEKTASMFKLMWSMKKKGYKPHYKPGTDKKYKKYQKNDYVPAGQGINETSMPHVDPKDKKVIRDRAKTLFKKDLKGTVRGVNEGKTWKDFKRTIDTVRGKKTEMPKPKRADDAGARARRLMKRKEHQAKVSVIVPPELED